MKGKKTRSPMLQPMIALVASHPNETNNRLADAWRSLGLDAEVVPAAWCLEQLRAGDTAIGRIDVRRSIDGVEPGLLDLLKLSRRGVSVLNGPAVLLTAHDKLRTARVLRRAQLPHPRTEHVTIESAGDDDRGRPSPASAAGVQASSAASRRASYWTQPRHRRQHWFRRQGAWCSGSSAGRTCASWSRGPSGRLRVARAAPGEWRNIALGGHRRPVVVPRAQALALAAPRRSFTSSGSTCSPTAATTP
jgi:hypothetical protein